MAQNILRSCLVATALLAAIALMPSITSHAEDTDAKVEAPIDLKQGKWGDLVKYISTYNYDAVFNDAGVKSELADITKGHDIDLGIEFAAKAPIGFEGSCLLLKGNQKSKANENSSFAEICVGGIVNLAVKKKSEITIYTRSDNYQYMSEGMRAWVYFQNNDMAIPLTKKPDNVQLVTIAP